MKNKIENIVKTLHKHGRVELNLIGLDIKKITIVKKKGFGLELRAREKVTHIEMNEIVPFLDHIAFFIETYSA